MAPCVSERRPPGCGFSEEFLKGVPKGAAAGLREFRATLKDLREAGGEKSPAEMVAAVLEGGYGEILRRQYTDVNSREEDLAQLASFRESSIPSALSLANWHC